MTATRPVHTSFSDEGAPVKILALDIATVTGFAIGEAGSIPRSGSVRLKNPSEPIEIAAFNLRHFLREQIFTFDRPDLVAIEAFMNPVAHKSADAAILGVGLYFVAAAEALAHGCRLEKAQAATIRKHFIGAGRMGERQATKSAVIQRAALLGYVPFGSRDDNRADACAVFDWAAATFARVRPEKLIMFGETA